MKNLILLLLFKGIFEIPLNQVDFNYNFGPEDNFALKVGLNVENEPFDKAYHSTEINYFQLTLKLKPG